MASRMSTAWYRQQAKGTFHEEGRIEVDDGAPVSRNSERGTDHGAYVQAWVWVPDPEPERNRRTGK
jgi:hypothetical protein